MTAELKPEAAPTATAKPDTAGVRTVNFGRHWAVLKNQKVIVFPMYVAENMPKARYDVYRSKLREALEMLDGRLLTGELVEEELDGRRQRFFVKMQNGKERAANRPPKRFKVYCPGYDEEEQA